MITIIYTLSCDTCGRTIKGFENGYIRAPVLDDYDEFRFGLGHACGECIRSAINHLIKNPKTNGSKND